MIRLHHQLIWAYTFILISSTHANSLISPINHGNSNSLYLQVLLKNRDIDQVWTDICSAGTKNKLKKIVCTKRLDISYMEKRLSVSSLYRERKLYDLNENFYQHKTNFYLFDIYLIFCKYDVFLISFIFCILFFTKFE